jgi:hypothetical protein
LVRFGAQEPTFVARTEGESLIQSGHRSIRNVPLHLTHQRPSRSFFLMKLAAAQQPLCDVGGLKRRTFGR